MMNVSKVVGYGSEGISSLKRIVRLRVGLRCRNLRKGDGITKMSDLTHSRMRANEPQSVLTALFSCLENADINT